MKKELKTILYAEDDEDIRTIATMALEAVGGFVILVAVRERKHWKRRLAPPRT